MVFLGQVVSNVLTLCLFALALFVVLRHMFHSAMAIADVATLGGWGHTPPEWLVQRAAASTGVVLAMTSSFGLHWWLTMGAVPGTLPRVPHLGEFFGHFLPGFATGLFGEWPWIWYRGTLGTPVWGMRIFLLVGSVIFVGLMLRAALRGQITVRDRWPAVWAVVRNFAEGFLGVATVVYWWPAGMGDRPFFTVVMVVLSFALIGMFSGAASGGSGSSGASSGASGGGWSGAGSDRPGRDTGEEDVIAKIYERNTKAAKEAEEKWRKGEREIWEKRDKDEQKRRADEEERRRKQQEQERSAQRAAQKAAEDLAYELREAAKKAEFDAREQLKAEEHRRKNPPW
ncbi:hypothetical protein [Pseudotabrizicola sp. 4114]|uniref:hypothetical protein n=1 Tax=Pseudotabrizicola sp. 4114 TaxID=2817731 RepID=UPI002863AC32|nr:putative membrane protein YgcG [Pseudorhodobacter sp. 4114]